MPWGRHKYHTVETLARILNAANLTLVLSKITETTRDYQETSIAGKGCWLLLLCSNQLSGRKLRNGMRRISLHVQKDLIGFFSLESLRRRQDLSRNHFSSSVLESSLSPSQSLGASYQKLTSNSNPIF